MAALSAPTWERVKQGSYSSSRSWFLYTWSWFLYGWFLYTWFLYGWFLYTWFLYGWFLYTWSWFLYTWSWFLYIWSWFHPVPGQAAAWPPSTSGPLQPGPWAARAAPTCSATAPSGPSWCSSW